MIIECFTKGLFAPLDIRARHRPPSCRATTSQFRKYLPPPVPTQPSPLLLIITGIHHLFLSTRKPDNDSLTFITLIIVCFPFKNKKPKSSGMLSRPHFSRLEGRHESNNLNLILKILYLLLCLWEEEQKSGFFW